MATDPFTQGFNSTANTFLTQFRHRDDMDFKQQQADEAAKRWGIENARAAEAHATDQTYRRTLIKNNQQSYEHNKTMNPLLVHEQQNKNDSDDIVLDEARQRKAARAEIENFYRDDEQVALDQKKATLAGTREDTRSTRIANDDAEQKSRLQAVRNVSMDSNGDPKHNDAFLADEFTMEGAVMAINRFRPDLIDPEGTGRRAIGFVRGPNNTASIIVQNPKTDSVGPATDGMGNGPNEKVVTIDLSDPYAISKLFAKSMAEYQMEGTRHGLTTSTDRGIAQRQYDLSPEGRALGEAVVGATAGLKRSDRDLLALGEQYKTLREETSNIDAQLAAIDQDIMAAQQRLQAGDPAAAEQLTALIRAKQALSNDTEQQTGEKPLDRVNRRSALEAKIAEQAAISQKFRNSGRALGDIQDNRRNAVSVARERNADLDSDQQYNMATIGQRNVPTSTEKKRTPFDKAKDLNLFIKDSVSDVIMGKDKQGNPKPIDPKRLPIINNATRTFIENTLNMDIDDAMSQPGLKNQLSAAAQLMAQDQNRTVRTLGPYMLAVSNSWNTVDLNEAVALARKFTRSTNPDVIDDFLEKLGKSFHAGLSEREKLSLAKSVAESE